jgi:hypothetical protein
MHGMMTAAVAAVLSVSFASPVLAFSFSPAATKFTLTGTLFFGAHGRQVQCTATLDGVTGKAGTAAAKITSAVFTGGEPCPSATNLPWKLTASGVGAASIANLAYIGNTGQCGPSAEVFTIDWQGVWSIRATDLRGGCSLIGSGLASHPPVTIVP